MMKQIICASLLILLFGCEAGSGEFLPEEEDEPPILSGDLLSEIQATVFTPICTECHIGEQAPLGLNLENVDIAFESLVNVTAIGNSEFLRVKPNDSENSFIYLKIAGDPRAGQRMPLGRSPLTATSIQLIKEWINQGALPAEQSRVTTKISSLVKQPQAITEWNSYLITFNTPINSDSINYDSVFVYEKYQGQEWLIDTTEYRINPITDHQVELQINLNYSTQHNLKLVLNDPAGQSILNQKGELLDGDNNNNQGGVYEYYFE